MFPLLLKTACVTSPAEILC